MARPTPGASAIAEQLTKQVEGGDLTVSELTAQLARAKNAGFDGDAVVRVNPGPNVTGIGASVQRLHFVTYEKPTPPTEHRPY